MRDSQFRYRFRRVAQINSRGQFGCQRYTRFRLNQIPAAIGLATGVISVFRSGRSDGLKPGQTESALRQTERKP